MSDAAVLTTAEAAARLRVSVYTVIRWIKQGKLRGVLVGGSRRAGWRIPASEVERLLRGEPGETEQEHGQEQRS